MSHSTKSAIVRISALKKTFDTAATMKILDKYTIIGIPLDMIGPHFQAAENQTMSKIEEISHLTAIQLKNRPKEYDLKAITDTVHTFSYNPKQSIHIFTDEDIYNFTRRLSI